MRIYEEIAKDILVAKDEIKADNNAKIILSNKYIMAWIIKECIEEFGDLEIKDIISCIEKTEYGVGINPGDLRIYGLSTEDNVPNEGIRYFDILTYLIRNDDKPVKVFLNIEPNGREDGDGTISSPRKIFYAIRGVSRQLDREFVGQNYQDIKKFYSIWIILNSPREKENTITTNFITQNPVDLKGAKSYDLFEVKTIYLGRERCNNNLINMLNTLFSNDLNESEKLEILNKEFGVMISTEEKEVMHNMKEIAYGYLVTGIEQGIEQGKAEGLEQGIEQGIEQNLADNIKSLMDTGKFDFTQAVELLKVEEKRIDKLKKMLCI